MPPKRNRDGDMKRWAEQRGAIWNPKIQGDATQNAKKKVITPLTTHFKKVAARKSEAVKACALRHLSDIILLQNGSILHLLGDQGTPKIEGVIEDPRNRLVLNRGAKNLEFGKERVELYFAVVEEHVKQNSAAERAVRNIAIERTRSWPTDMPDHVFQGLLASDGHLDASNGLMKFVQELSNFKLVEHVGRGLNKVYQFYNPGSTKHTPNIDFTVTVKATPFAKLTTLFDASVNPTSTQASQGVMLQWRGESSDDIEALGELILAIRALTDRKKILTEVEIRAYRARNRLFDQVCQALESATSKINGFSRLIDLLRCGEIFSHATVRHSGMSQAIADYRSLHLDSSKVSANTPNEVIFRDYDGLLGMLGEVAGRLLGDGSVAQVGAKSAVIMLMAKNVNRMRAWLLGLQLLGIGRGVKLGKERPDGNRRLSFADSMDIYVFTQLFLHILVKPEYQDLKKVKKLVGWRDKLWSLGGLKAGMKPRALGVWRNKAKSKLSEAIAALDNEDKGESFRLSILGKQNFADMKKKKKPLGSSASLDSRSSSAESGDQVSGGEESSDDQESRAWDSNTREQHDFDLQVALGLSMTECDLRQFGDEDGWLEAGVSESEIEEVLRESGHRGTVRETPRDGSCQFHAFLSGLKNLVPDDLDSLPENAFSLRTLLVNSLKDLGKYRIVGSNAAGEEGEGQLQLWQAQELGDDDADAHSWPDYLRKLGEAGIYGNGHTLLALALHFQVRVRVFHVKTTDGGALLQSVSEHRSLVAHAESNLLAPGPANQELGTISVILVDNEHFLNFFPTVEGESSGIPQNFNLGGGALERGPGGQPEADGSQEGLGRVGQTKRSVAEMRSESEREELPDKSVPSFSREAKRRRVVSSASGSLSSAGFLTSGGVAPGVPLATGKEESTVDFSRSSEDAANVALMDAKMDWVDDSDVSFEADESDDDSSEADDIFFELLSGTKTASPSTVVHPPARRTVVVPSSNSGSSPFV